MQYFKVVEKEEHLLYATEIAKLYNIYTYPGRRPAKLLVGLLIDEYLSSSGLKDEQLYYHTANGYMVKCYDKKTYSLVMNKFFKELYLNYSDKKDNDYILFSHGTRKYKIANI